MVPDLLADICESDPRRFGQLSFLIVCTKPCIEILALPPANVVLDFSEMKFYPFISQLLIGQGLKEFIKIYDRNVCQVFREKGQCVSLDVYRKKKNSWEAVIKQK